MEAGPGRPLSGLCPPEGEALPGPTQHGDGAGPGGEARRRGGGGGERGRRRHGTRRHSRSHASTERPRLAHHAHTRRTPRTRSDVQGPGVQEGHTAHTCMHRTHTRTHGTAGSHRAAAARRAQSPGHTQTRSLAPRAEPGASGWRQTTPPPHAATGKAEGGWQIGDPGGAQAPWLAGCPPGREGLGPTCDAWAAAASPGPGTGSRGSVGPANGHPPLSPPPSGKQRPPWEVGLFT